MARAITVVSSTWVGTELGVSGLTVIVNRGTPTEQSFVFPADHAVDVGESMARQGRGLVETAVPLNEQRQCPARLDG